MSDEKLKIPISCRVNIFILTRAKIIKLDRELKYQVRCRIKITYFNGELKNTKLDVEVKLFILTEN